MDDGTTEKTYSVGELAEVVGITRRAIRYYVQQGVLPPPIGLGRSAHYNDTHVDALRRVLALQQSGVHLATMRQELDDTGILRMPWAAEDDLDHTLGIPSQDASPHWMHVEVVPGVEIHIREDRLADLDPGVLASVTTLLQASLHTRTPGHRG